MISIHALREEGDRRSRPQSDAGKDFYPRPPRGGRQGVPALSEADRRISIHALREEGDAVLRAVVPQDGISIHALREEGDPDLCSEVRSFFDFYPRPPRGGRHAGVGSVVFHVSISIHALREEGDRLPTRGHLHRGISIHALREEGDRKYFRIRSVSTYFYPRPPRGGRPLPERERVGSMTFLSTPSARRATDCLSSS